MKARWLPSLAACLLFTPPARAEPLDLHAGTWEITTRVSQPQRTQVESLCLSERSMINLVQGPDTIEDDPCHPAVPAKVGRRAWSIVLNCEDGSQIHARLALQSSQSLSGTVVRVGGRRALLQKLDIRARWLRGTCARR